MNYSIGEVSKMLGLPISTIRYYDQHGLLPYMNRTDGNIRVFSDEDVECLKVVESLKKTGLKLREIQQFFNWCQAGDSTIRNRYELFKAQIQATEQKIQELQETVQYLKYKCTFYEQALLMEKSITLEEEAQSNLEI